MMKKLLSMVATTSNFQKVMLLFTHTFILYFHKITTEKKVSKFRFTTFNLKK